MVSNILQMQAFEAHFNDHVPNDVWVGVLPFYHIYGMSLALHISPFYGHTLVVVPKFELESFLTVLQKYQVGLAHIGEEPFLLFLYFNVFL
jgi:acyl-CoA synthetase (AMP-forming)/AMP-acid ligase II